MPSKRIATYKISSPTPMIDATRDLFGCGEDLTPFTTTSAPSLIKGVFFLLPALSSLPSES